MAQLKWKSYLSTKKHVQYSHQDAIVSGMQDFIVTPFQHL